MPHAAKGKRVYIAAPLGKEENWKENIAKAVEAWTELTRLGFYAYCPHINCYLHNDSEADFDYEFWLDYDIAWLDICDYLLRLPGYSPGAEREMRYAHENGIKVVYTLPELIDAYYRAIAGTYKKGKL